MKRKLIIIDIGLAVILIALIAVCILCNREQSLPDIASVSTQETVASDIKGSESCTTEHFFATIPSTETVSFEETTTNPVPSTEPTEEFRDPSTETVPATTQEEDGPNAGAGGLPIL